MTLTTQDKNSFLQKMIGLISHDVLVPLQYISKTTARLTEQGENISDKLRNETIEEISIASACLAELVQTLLQWTKAQEGNFTVTHTSFNVLSALQEIIPMHKAILASGKNELVTEIDPLLKFHYDPVLFRIIIHNLVMNAAKFTSGGKVTVRCTVKPEGLLTEVSDTGTGMPAGIIEQLQQSHTVSSAASFHNQTGPGMGYTIIFQLVKASEGAIHIHSSPAKGTQVKVLLGVKTQVFSL